MPKRKRVRPPDRKVKVRPLKHVKVEIRGSLVRDFDKRLRRVERTLGQGSGVQAIGFTMHPYWEDDDE